MLHRLLSSPFVKNVFTVLQGNAVGILIGFLTLPLLSRLYSPTAFGIFQSAQSFLSLFLVAVSWRYEIPILMARGPMELKSVVTLNLVLNVAMAGLAALACAAASVLYSRELHNFRYILLVGPLWLLSASLMQTFSYVALRNHAFSLTARAKIAQSSFNAGVGILLGKIGLLAIGLVLADFTGRAVSAGTLFTRGRNTLLPGLARRDLRAMRVAATRYRNFPRISLFSALINAMGGMMSPILMLMCFNAAIIGQFAIVERSAGIAISVVGQSVSQVFMSTFAQSLRGGEGDALHIFRHIIVVQFLIGILPSLILAAVFPWLFTLFFGIQWHLAGEFGVILMPLYLVGFVVTPVNMALLILEDQYLQFIWDLFRMIGVVAIWAAAAVVHASPLHAMAGYSAFGCAAYLIYLGMADVAIRRRLNTTRTKSPHASAASS